MVPNPRPVFYTQHRGPCVPTQFFPNSSGSLYTRKTHPMCTQLTTLLASVQNPLFPGWERNACDARHFPSRFSVLGAIFPVFPVSFFLAAAQAAQRASARGTASQKTNESSSHHGSVQGKTTIHGSRASGGRRRRGESSVTTMAARHEPRSPAARFARRLARKKEREPSPVSFS